MTSFTRRFSSTTAHARPDVETASACRATRCATGKLARTERWRATSASDDSDNAADRRLNCPTVPPATAHALGARRRQRNASLRPLRRVFQLRHRRRRRRRLQAGHEH